MAKLSRTVFNLIKQKKPKSHFTMNEKKKDRKKRRDKHLILISNEFICTIDNIVTDIR